MTTSPTEACIDRPSHFDPARDDTGLRSILAAIWQQTLDREQPIRDDDSFFEIGGDSITAMLVLLTLEEQIGRKVPVHLFFRTPRLADLVCAIAELASGSDEATPPPPLPARSSDRIFPLSPQQRQLWFLEQLHGPNASYNIPLVYRIAGWLDRDRLAGALDAVVARHEVLRSVYIQVDGIPMQVIGEPLGIALAATDLSILPATQQDAGWRRIAEADMVRPFDLATGPVLRARLVTLSPTEHLLVLCIHHIAFDGWSASVLTNDLCALYAATEGPSLRPVAQYADYAASLAHERDEPARQRLLDDWVSLLRDRPTRNDIPTDRPRRPGGRGQAGAVVHVMAGPDLSALRTLARSRDTTLFVVLHAALSLLMSRYTRQRDVLIGTPMANRGRPDLLTMIGFFANSLVLRNDVDGASTVERFLDATASRVQAAFERQALPFDVLVEALNPDRTMVQNPIFDVMFVLQSTPRGTTSLRGATLSTVHVPNPTAKFDLMLNVMLGEDEATLEWEFDRALYDEASVVVLAEKFRHVLASFCRSPDARLDAISTVGGREAAMIAQWDTASRDMPYRSIAAAFEAVAMQFGSVVAIRAGQQDISYAALDQRADGLAQRLAALGVRKGEPVGLLLPRGIDAVAAMLGILKAGGAYLPIDPTYPDARIAFLAEDAGLRMAFVAPGEDAGRLPPAVQALPVDEAGPEDATLRIETGPRDPAYIMYTSGSTGTPKGVFVPQEGILRLVLNPGYVDLGPGTVMLHSTSISFDTSGFEIWGALLNGGRLVAHADIFDGAAVAQLMRRERVDTTWMTSGVLEVFAAALDGPLPDLRWLVAGGDVVPPKAVAALYQDNPSLTVVNGYGPTENSVLTCCHHIPRDLDITRSIPIGRPIVNTVVDVIDAAGQPSGIGIPGELVCAGGPVGLGYHDRESLNRERFPPDPIRPGMLRYRTGDLVRLLHDGTIEYLGRQDNQLKVRGYRIEPAEIETALQRHPAVALAAVTVHGEAASARFIVGWVRPSGQKPLVLAELERWLKTELPEPSRPAYLRTVPTFPVTANGKFDRAAMAASFRLERDAGSAPATRSERRLAAIWTDLLAIEGAIGRNETFLGLGGNSLLSVKLVARINEAFHIAASVRIVFECPRLQDLATAVDALAAGPARTDRVTRLTASATRQWLALPGIGATGAAFLGLAEAMAGSDEALVVLEHRGLNGDEAAHDRLAPIVLNAADAAAAGMDRGTARLIGHSYGGRLAFETALTLEQRGHNVELLLLDSLPGNDLADVSFRDLADTDDAVAAWLLQASGAGSETRHVSAVEALAGTGLVAANQVGALINLARAQFAINRAYHPTARLLRTRVNLVYARRSCIGAHLHAAILADLQRWCPSAQAAPVDGDHFSMLRNGVALRRSIATARKAVPAGADA